jgi:hypothetical protein
MFTRAFVPLKLKASPYLPDVVQVPPLMLPLFPLPDTSCTTVPLPSLNPYAATRLGVGVGVAVAVGVGVGIAVAVGVGVPAFQKELKGSPAPPLYNRPTSV